MSITDYDNDFAHYERDDTDRKKLVIHAID